MSDETLLAKLIDKGRDYNIPLIATPKKLAENAITKQECDV